MEIDRRGLLKAAGLSLLGLVGGSAWHVISRAKLPEPSSTPKTLVGKKWGMVIDLKKCWGTDGCTDCIDVCHRVHNVPDLGNPKDEIKWIWTVPFGRAFPEHGNEFTEEALKGRPVTVLCNQCDNPPCIKYCPTRATWRREDGIVMMDFHRCIGCRYCMAGCPYGSRSFNWKNPRPFIKKVNFEFPTRTKGVVEKCNFCQERLVQGLLPACVEACKERALIFGDLNDPDSEVRKILRSRHTIQRHPELGTKPKVFYVL
jgi:molybdopterin-containing oxidoreductase family iron-sulfur binding subunit